MRRLLLSIFLIGMLGIPGSYVQSKATTDLVIQMKIEKLKSQEAEDIEKLKNKTLKNSDRLIEKQTIR